MTERQPVRKLSHDAAEPFGRHARDTTATCQVRHPAPGRQQQAVGAPPGVLSFTVEGMRTVGVASRRLLLVDKIPDAERRRIALVDALASHDDAGGVRYQAFDVRPLDPTQKRVLPALGIGWSHETEVDILHLGFEARIGVETQGIAVDIEVTVTGAEAILRIGGISCAEFEVPRRCLDHSQRHRGVVGERGVGCDGGLHAGKVSGAEQPPYVIVEHGSAIRLAAL